LNIECTLQLRVLLAFEGGKLLIDFGRYRSRHLTAD